MKRFRKNGRVNKATNAIGEATTTSKDFGYVPIPGKGGASANYDAELKDEEIKKIIRKVGTSNA